MPNTMNDPFRSPEAPVEFPEALKALHDLPSHALPGRPGITDQLDAASSIVHEIYKHMVLRDPEFWGPERGPAEIAEPALDPFQPPVAPRRQVRIDPFAPVRIDGVELSPEQAAKIATERERRETERKRTTGPLRFSGRVLAETEVDGARNFLSGDDA